ncbi:nitronate monooxygenase [Actinomycetospora sp.]|uniref:nitronate monooxygenase n=1 Tax=Actinomycetospora sp. TaxID=1872135 RepID=UPI002F42C817
MRTALTEMLGVEHPLVGFNRSPAVVAAVTNAGGFGVLAASMYSPAELDGQLTWIESQVGGRPYGVDLLVPEKFAVSDPDDLVASLRAQIPAEHFAFVDALLDEYGLPADSMPRSEEDALDEIAAAINPAGAQALLDVTFSHRIAMVANALGPPPADLVSRAHADGVVVASLVGQRKHALHQIDAGVDVLVAQGTEAGGHTGTVATTVLAPEVVEVAGDRPVLAAGGIATGAQMAAALALGAAGVWCGSVWLSSEEDITPRPVKEKFLAAGSSDTLRSRTMTGKPARQLRSAWHDAWDRPDAPAPLPLPLQPMLAGRAWNRVHAAAADGHPGATALDTYFIGQVVGGFTALRPAGEITREIVGDCTRRLRALGELAGS